MILFSHSMILLLSLRNNSVMSANLIKWMAAVGWGREGGFMVSELMQYRLVVVNPTLVLPPEMPMGG